MEIIRNINTADQLLDILSQFSKEQLQLMPVIVNGETHADVYAYEIITDGNVERGIQLTNSEDP